MSLEEGALHLRHRVAPVGGVFFEEGPVAQQAADPRPPRRMSTIGDERNADPAAEDDAGPVADRAAEGDPGWGGGVGVAAVLDLDCPQARDQFSFSLSLCLSAEA